MNIHTILFDLDGTLIDTNELIFASFDHTFKQYNLSFTREELAEFNGPPLSETFIKLDPVRAKDMVATYREHNHANHDEYVKAFPQVTDTIYQLKRKGIKLGIVSTKMSDAVKMGLVLTELDTFFESVITLDDVTQAKPHPEPIWKALEDLQADPATTLMVGDNHHDIEAGKNAHVQTAGVAWSQKGKERLLEYDPTYMLEEMYDLLKIIEV